MKPKGGELSVSLHKRCSASSRGRFGFRGSSTAGCKDKSRAEINAETGIYGQETSCKSRLNGLYRSNPAQSQVRRFSMSKLPLKNKSQYHAVKLAELKRPSTNSLPAEEENMSDDDEIITNAFAFNAAKGPGSHDMLDGSNEINTDNSSTDSIPRTSSVGSKNSVSKSVRVSRIHSQHLPHIRHATRKLSLGDADELRRFQDRFQKKDVSPLPSRSVTGRRGSCPTILRNSSFRMEGKSAVMDILPFGYCILADVWSVRYEVCGHRQVDFGV